MKMSQYEKAKAAFESALTLGAARWSVLHDMGYYEQEGAPEKALTFYRRALSMRKGASETHFRIAGVLKELGKRGEAVSHFRQAISLDPDNANAHYGLAQVLLARGDAEEGIKTLEHVFDLKRA